MTCSEQPLPPRNPQAPYGLQHNPWIQLEGFPLLHAWPPQLQVDQSFLRLFQLEHLHHFQQASQAMVP
jgi:hypothetical protein